MTAAVPTTWGQRFDLRPGLLRVRDSAGAVAQITIAATAAYSFAAFVLGHVAPLVALTVTISSLGLVRDARPRRVLDTVIGMLVGIVVAETLWLSAGSGWWQLAVVLGVTLLLARLLSPQPSFAIAAAIQSVIVIMIAQGAPFQRLLDGVIGGIAALAATALVPRNTTKAARRDGRAVFDALDAAGTALVQALRRGDRMRAERSLEKARAITPLVDAWRQSIDSGVAIARISPFLRRQRAELARNEAICRAGDLAVRNLRVAARRAVALCDDGMPRPVAADLLSDILRGAAHLAASIDDPALAPAVRDSFVDVAGRLDPHTAAPSGSLADQDFVLALRPLAVDLMVGAGMPSDRARAALPPV